MEPMALGAYKMRNKKKKSLLVVCLGNICRSPALEIILKRLFETRGMQQIHVESRGLSEKQVGKRIDGRISAALVTRDYEVYDTAISELLREEDFYEFDYILAVDNKVLKLIKEQKPGKSTVYLDLASCWSDTREEIFDPYKEPDERVGECVDLIEKHARRIVDFIEKEQSMS